MYNQSTPHNSSSISQNPLIDLSLLSSQPFNLVLSLQKQLSNISQQLIKTLCIKLYPVQHSNVNPLNSLYKQFINYFNLHFSKGNNYQSIVNQICKCAYHVNQSLGFKISEFLKRQQVKQKILQNTKKNNGLANNYPSYRYTTNSNIQNNSKHINNIDNKKVNISSSSFLQNLGNKIGSQSVSNKYVNLLNKQLNDTFKKDSQQIININHFNTGVIDRCINQKSQIQNLIHKIYLNKQYTQFGKFCKKYCVICQNILNEENQLLGDKYVLRCRDCGEYYHRKCMPRDNNCAICQLKYINPLQRVKTVLFLGILKKGTKRHEIEFQLLKKYLQQQNQSIKNNPQNKPSYNPPIMPLIQLRSIRIKDGSDSVSNFINLFPDACSIMVNGRLIKEFQPLHKQSSLKYRRDECMKISNFVNAGINKIVISQRVLKKQIKQDERIQLQNHLVGVYIIQSMQIPKQINKLQHLLTKSGYLLNNNQPSIQKFLQHLQSRINEYEQSQNLLKQSMLIKNNQNNQKHQLTLDDQQIVCDSIKVPLICSLTLQKMKYPGRTIFCKHFACFDVYYFILLNSQAKLPKWQCPICKVSAYKFTIDCIINSIIEQINKIKQNQKITNSKYIKQIKQIKQCQQIAQIQFDKNLNIKLINSQGHILIPKKSTIPRDKNLQYIQTQFIPFWINNVADLPIQGKNKRHPQNTYQTHLKSNILFNPQQHKSIPNPTKKIMFTHIDNQNQFTPIDHIIQTNIINQSKSNNYFNQSDKDIYDKVFDRVGEKQIIAKGNNRSQQQKQGDNQLQEFIIPQIIEFQFNQQQQNKSNKSNKQNKQNKQKQPQQTKQKQQYQQQIKNKQQQPQQIKQQQQQNKNNKILGFQIRIQQYKSKSNQQTINNKQSQISNQNQNYHLQHNNNLYQKINVEEMINQLKQNQQQIRKLYLFGDNEKEKMIEQSKCQIKNTQNKDKQITVNELIKENSTNILKQILQQKGEIERSIQQDQQSLQKPKRSLPSDNNPSKKCNPQSINSNQKEIKQKPIQKKQVKFLQNIQICSFQPDSSQENYYNLRSDHQDNFHTLYQQYQIQQTKNSGEWADKSIKENQNLQFGFQEDNSQLLTQNNKNPPYNTIPDKKSQKQQINKSPPIQQTFQQAHKTQQQLFKPYTSSSQKKTSSLIPPKKNTRVTRQNTGIKSNKNKNKIKQKQKYQKFINIPKNADIVQLSD